MCFKIGLVESPSSFRPILTKFSHHLSFMRFNQLVKLVCQGDTNILIPFFGCFPESLVFVAYYRRVVFESERCCCGEQRDANFPLLHWFVSNMGFVKVVLLTNTVLLAFPHGEISWVRLIYFQLSRFSFD